MANKLKNLNKEEVKHLETVVGWTLNYYIEHIFPWIYEIIKMKTGYTADIESQLKKLDPKWDSSYYVFPIIEPNTDAFIANSYDIDTFWRPVPIKTDSDGKAMAKDAEDYLSWVETITNWKDIEDSIRAEAALVWTSYCKFSYIKKRTSKLPYAEHISFFDLFAVPWARDFYKSRYKIYRTIKSDNQIESLYGWLLKDKDTKKFIDKRWECFVDWDFNKIWDLKYYEKSLTEEVENIITEWSVSPVEVFTKALTKQFMVIDWENGNNEIIEVWDWGKCHVFINREYMASYEEYEDSPFGCVVFEKQSWTYLGRWLWHKLMASQLEANFLYNSLRKWIRQDVFPDTMTIPWAIVDPVTWQTPVELSYQWGKNYNVNPSATFGWEAFRKISYTDQNTLAILRWRLVEVTQEAQMISWTSSYTLWWQGKIERVAWWVAQRNEVFLARLKPLSSSIKSMKGYAFTIWLEIAKKIDKNLIIKISENWEETTVKDIKVDDILNKTHVWVETETNKTIRRYEDITLWTQVLWVLSPFANMPEAQKYMVAILKKVTKDYAYDAWEDFGEWEETQQQWPWIEELMQQAQWLEAQMWWEDAMMRNNMLWEFISGIPVDWWDETEIPWMQF